MTETSDMNMLIRRAVGRGVVDATADGTAAEPLPTSYAGKSDAGEGSSILQPHDMNVLLRRATGRHGYVDEGGRSWA